MKIREAIIVEGVYDKIKLDSFLDAVIIKTDGFGIFKNTEKLKLIKNLAEKTGIVILTDSDRAGFAIRNYLKGIVDTDKIKQAFIPDIKGKEKRKKQSSKEGLLGVEGVEKNIIINALKNAGCTINGEQTKAVNRITKLDFYNDGFSGRHSSHEKRIMLAKFFNLPSRMSAKELLNALNALCTYEQYKEAAQKLEKTIANL